MNRNKLNTPFKELYPTFQDYQRHEAEGMLSLLGTYKTQSGYVANLDSNSDVRIYGLQKEKKELEENRARLRAYISGECENPLYRIYYDHLCKVG